MKKLLFLLTLCAGASLTIGCGGGPGIATDEEANLGMEETMAVDTMAEAEAADAGAGAEATP